MAAYYNEIDPFAAQWLRNLIKAGHIADGVVDERSIVEVQASDLRSFIQCHFFAGIGVWSHSLRRAGWPDYRPVWTGSCPCQPFSAAGKKRGFADERHLWPTWFKLIEECRPPVVFGEQVASPDGLTWLDTVLSDLEGADYAARAFDICAAGVGAPHIRQRLWIVAHTDGGQHGGVQYRSIGVRQPGGTHEGSPRQSNVESSAVDSGAVADSGHTKSSARRSPADGDTEPSRERSHDTSGHESAPRRDVVAVADAASPRPRNAQDCGTDRRDQSTHSGAHDGRKAGVLEPERGRTDGPLAHAERGRSGALGAGEEGDGGRTVEPDRHGSTRTVGDSDDERRDGEHPLLRSSEGRWEPGALPETSGPSAASAVGDSDNEGPQGREFHTEHGDEQSSRPSSVGCGGFWSNAEWLPCLDGKARPIEPGSFPLVDGAPGRVGRLRAYGNAIVAPVAQTFIKAYVETLLVQSDPDLDFDDRAWTGLFMGML